MSYDTANQRRCIMILFGLIVLLLIWQVVTSQALARAQVDIQELYRLLMMKGPAMK
jgi:TRAP-type C4-dicarboxylate transport system permease small subunit